MDNLGKAIYMAAFALMFVVATSTAIYLYGTLSNYLNTSSNILGVNSRSEAALSSNADTRREIRNSEIYITLFNMRQMHVDKLTVGGNSITPDEVDKYNADPASVVKVGNVLSFLSSNSGPYSYSSSEITLDDGTTGIAVTYTKGT